MSNIKIKWITEERDNIELGRMIRNSEYTVDSTLGGQLISQGFAIEIKKDQEAKKDSQTKKGGK